MRTLLLLILAGALLGALAGAGRALTADDLYRAEVKIAVGQGQALFPERPQAAAAGPVTETLAALVRSRVVADNVVANLRLTDVDAGELLDRVHVRAVGDANVLDVTVDDSEPQRAVRIAQEIALVFAQLVKERFTPTTGDTSQLPLTAVVFDAAHEAGPAGPEPVRDGLLGAALGGALGLIAGGLLRAHRRSRASEQPAELLASLSSRERELATVRDELSLARRAADDAARELAAERSAREAATGADSGELAKARGETARLREELAKVRAQLAERRDGEDEMHARRSETITARELQAARLHVELTARARALDEREAALAEPRPEPEPAPAPEPESEPQPEPVPAPAAEVAPAAATELVPPPPPESAATGAPPSLVELESLVERNRARFPERAEDWLYYLVYLRDHADTSGRLPDSFTWLVEDVFGELLAIR